MSWCFLIQKEEKASVHKTESRLIQKEQGNGYLSKSHHILSPRTDELWEKPHKPTFFCERLTGCHFTPKFTIDWFFSFYPFKKRWLVSSQSSSCYLSWDNLVAVSDRDLIFPLAQESTPWAGKYFKETLENLLLRWDLGGSISPYLLEPQVLPD